MENVPLRTYLREIDYLIEEKKSIMAFNQCVQVLGFFPKDVAALQQLGKIELDLGDLNQAEDIFNLIHLILPDDLTASIGLSCIFETRNNPEKAAQYMERAFEHQPSNKMLQDELKRLRSLRDQTAHVKIKLTRGALLKLYMRSKLYNQAISEIQLGLAEYPNRRDFKLELAKAYYESGQNIEAFELSLQILQELPFCLEANRICFMCLSRDNDFESAERYKLILSDLDPYYQHFASHNHTIAEIPDISVSIPRQEVSNQSLTEFNLSEYFKSVWDRQNEKSSSSSLSQPSADLTSDAFSLNSLPEVEIEPLPLPNWALGETSEQEVGIQLKDIQISSINASVREFEEPLPIDADVPPSPEIETGDYWQKLPEAKTLIKESAHDTELIIVEPNQVSSYINSLQIAIQQNDIEVFGKIAPLLLNSKIQQEEIKSAFDKYFNEYPDRVEIWTRYGESLLKAGEIEKSLIILNHVQQSIKL